MSHHVPLFLFRLSNGQSIGPSALRRLWSTACGTDDVVVSRETREGGHGAPIHTYTLCGPASANLPNIEARLRRLLAETALTATITLTHPS
jgi:hypothetical protein